MKAGALDRRIAILRAEWVDDGLQRRLGEPAEIGKRWASATPVRDSERMAQGQTQAVVEMRFQVRFDSLTRTLTEADLVEFEGARFEIVGLKEVGRRKGVEISAARIVEPES
jgi:head-tail adaptor